MANLGNSTNVPPTPPTVAAISTATNVVTNNIVLGFSPIVLAETPDAKKLYAVGGGNGAVSWVVTRSDSQRAYVLNQGTGKVTVIDTSSDAVLGSVSVGAGANFMLYDKTRSRLYVTNPTANTVTALDASVDPTNPPNPPLFVVPVAANPLSVAALADGSRIYVASVVVSGGSATSQITVINASDGSVRTTIPLSTVGIDTANPTGCGAPNPFAQPLARFRVFVAASADSSRVYVTNCDAGNTTIIRTADDTEVLDVPAPLSDFPTQNGANPPPQNPVFVLAGP